VDQAGILDPEAIARTVAVLEEFRQKMRAFAVENVRMVATSAVRDAVNGGEFVLQAEESVGVTPEILSGPDEGQLAYSGASSDLPAFDGDTLVIDIGGGSTELIRGRGKSICAVSLQLGCVRLTERHFHHDPPTLVEMELARSTIEGELERGEAELPGLVDLAHSRRLIGLAGTVSTLAALQLGLANYDFELLHHSVITVIQIRQLCSELAKLSSAERAKLVGMTTGREDVILGGVLILESVASRYEFDHVLVSERDILDGIALTLR
jgi:exopolyphosphatase/guanosine-5'-triphosphate,3'-diphosphate pyrophosphatase